MQWVYTKPVIPDGKLPAAFGTFGIHPDNQRSISPGQSGIPDKRFQQRCFFNFSVLNQFDSFF
jgi:hypothetical protein